MRFHRLALVALVGAGMVAAYTAQAQQIMNMGFTLSADSHYGAGADAFAAEIDRLSGGKFKVVPKPSGALGGERDVIEGLQIGSIALTISEVRSSTRVSSSSRVFLSSSSPSFRSVTSRLKPRQPEWLPFSSKIGIPVISIVILFPLL